jgi:hypothetical protein
MIIKNVISNVKDKRLSQVQSIEMRLFPLASKTAYIYRAEIEPLCRRKKLNFDGKIRRMDNYRAVLLVIVTQRKLQRESGTLKYRLS